MKLPNCLKNLNSRKGNEKGSVTLFVLIAMLFFLMIGMMIFIINMNTETSQKRDVEKIKSEYNANTSETDLEQLYQEAKQRQIGTFMIKLIDKYGTIYNSGEWVNENWLAEGRLPLTVQPNFPEGLKDISVTVKDDTYGGSTIITKTADLATMEIRADKDCQYTIENTLDNTNQVKINIDTTKPTIDELKGGTIWKGTEEEEITGTDAGGTVTITARDNLSGVKELKYIINNSPEAPSADAEWTTVEGATAQVTINNENDLGVYYIHAMATDVAGNVRDVVTSGPYEVKQANYKITTTTGTTYSETLKDAAEKPGAMVIKVLNTFTDEVPATIAQNVTIDTNGKTLTMAETITVAANTTATFVDNATTKGKLQRVVADGVRGDLITNNGTVVVGVQNSETGPTLTSKDVVINNGTVTVYSGNIASQGQSGFALNAGIYSKTINVYGGNITNDSGAYGIVINLAGICNITGGRITGNKAICPQNGTLNISGSATIEGNAAIGSSASTNHNYTLNISGGVIRSTSRFAINADTPETNITITGGTITGATDGISITGANSTLTIGNNSNALDRTAPVITGTNGKGINIAGATSTLNYYDGTIIGKEKGTKTFNGREVAFSVKDDTSVNFLTETEANNVTRYYRPYTREKKDKNKVTYYETVLEKQVNVTFNPGEGATVAENNRNVLTNVEYKEKADTAEIASLPTPEKTGYTFKGWNGKNKLNSNLYSGLYNNGTLGTTNSDVYKSTEFTNVLPSGNYVISCKNNDIRLIRCHILSENRNTTTNSTLPYILNLTSDSQIGLTFRNSESSSTIWNLGDDTITAGIQLEEGTTATPYEPYYIVDNTKVVQDQDHELKAVWEENEYTVHFNGDGSTAGTVEDQKFKYDEEKALNENKFERKYTVTYDGNEGTPAKANDTATYTFANWINKTNNLTYQDKAVVKNLTSEPNGEVTLYAVWTPHEVTLPTATREGYIFNGWYDAATGGNKIGDAGDKYIPEADTRLYAQWRQVHYTILVGEENLVAETLEEAIKLAEDRITGSVTTATITAIMDYTDNSTATISKNIVIDLAGHTITMTNTITVAANTTVTFVDTETTKGKLIRTTGKLITNNGTVKVGTANSTNGANMDAVDRVVSGGNVEVNSGILNLTGAGELNTNFAVISAVNITVNGGQIINDYKHYGLITYAPSSVIDFTGGIIRAKDWGINSNATLNMSGTAQINSIVGIVTANGTINVSGGTITGGSYGIKNEANGNINVTGGTITGGTYGIHNTSNGIINVSGGTITGGTHGIYNNANGTINVSGSTTSITGTTDQGIRGCSGNVTVSDGTITGATHGISVRNDSNNNSGSIIITGGTITGNQYGLYAAGNSTITLGNNDGTVSKTTPEIISNATSSHAGVYTEGNTTFNFYDGKVVARDGWSLNTVNLNKPDHYQVVKTTADGKETAVLEKEVTVTFEPNPTGTTGGTVGEASRKVLTNVEYQYDATAGENRTLPTPTKTGYTFNGWRGKNLCPGLVKGIGLVHETGAEINANDRATSDYIPVDFELNSKYMLSGLSGNLNSYVAAYNKDKQFIGRCSGNTRTYFVISNTVFTTAVASELEDKDIKYIRVTQYEAPGNSGTINDVDNIKLQMEVGQLATPYEPYYITDTTLVARDSNHTLYADWSANPYTVTADANGGSIPATEGWTGTGDTATKSVTFDSQYGALPTPTRVGYDFAGWYKPTYDTCGFNRNGYGEGGKTIRVSSTENYATANKILNVGDVLEFDITISGVTISNIDMNDKTIDGSQYIINGNNVKGKIIITSDMAESGGKSGGNTYYYNFLDINCDAAITNYTINKFTLTQFDNNNKVETNTILTTPSDHKIYANWTPKQYTVHFDANGGTPTPADKTVTFDSAYGTLPEVTKTGYTFKGWNGKNQFDESKYTQTGDYTVQRSHYYWADVQLEPNKTYKVSIIRKNNFDGKINHAVLLLAKDKTPNPSSQWTSIAHYTSPTISYSNFEYTTLGDGKLYIGYYDETTQEDLDTIWENTDVQIEEGTTATNYQPYYITADTIVKTPNDHTLTALWEATPYTVTLNAGDGTIDDGDDGWTRAGDNKTATKDITYDSNYGTLPTASRTGYTFDGWYTDATNGTQITDVSIMQTASAQSLYAHWTANNYTVTAHANGGAIASTTGWSGTGESATKQVTYDSTYGTLPEVTKTGYTLKGWNGKNQFNKDATPYKTSYYIKGDGAEVPLGEYTLYQINVEPNTVYTITNSGGSIAPGYVVYNSSGTRVGGENYANKKYITFTTPSTAAYIRFSVVTHTSSYRFDKNTFQIEKNNEATTYEPYYITSETPVTTASNHDINAIWEANKYTVTANANGGTIASTTGWEGTGNTATKSVTYDSQYGTLPTASRTGYTLKGWKINGEGDFITNETILTTASNHTLKAVWEVNSYKLTKVTNSSNLITNGDFENYSLTNSPGWDNSLNGVPGNTSMAYYASNWSTGANMGVAVPEIGYHAHMRVIDGNAVFRYKTNEDYNGKTQADAPGGTSRADGTVKTGRWLGAAQVISKTSLKAGKTYAITMDVYRVSGTTYVNTGLHHYITSNDTIGFHSGKVDLIPTTVGQWQTITNTFTLSSDYDNTKDPRLYIYGYSGAPGELYIDNVKLEEVNTSDKNYDTSYTDAELATPTKTGYTFDGWYNNGKYDTQLTTSKIFNTENAVFNNVNEAGTNAFIYAKWTANTYTIHFDANGGTGEMADLPMTYGTPANLTANAFSRTGYKFVKWTSNADGTGNEYIDGQTVNNLTEINNDTVNLFAQWEERPFVVTFNPNGGIVTPESKEITYNSTYGDLPSGDNIKRLGYTFAGWYKEAELTNEVTSETTYDITEDSTLYAKWTPHVYTVTFNKNGGTGTMSDQSFTYGQTQNLRANTFTRTGYTFAGWARAENGTIEFTNEQSISNLTPENGGTITLYAVWNDVTRPSWSVRLLDIINK